MGCSQEAGYDGHLSSEIGGVVSSLWCRQCRAFPKTGWDGRTLTFTVFQEVAACTRIGGAAVSTKHAGFVVNLGGATEADVLALIAHIQKRVLETSGISLEPEVVRL